MLGTKSPDFERNMVMNMVKEQNEYMSEEFMEDKIEEKRYKRRKMVKNVIKEVCLYLILIFICLFIIPRYVIQRTIVDGNSMQDTLQTKDNLLVEKLTYRFSDPKRFDVVIFYPYGKEIDEYYVKRVIGLPGEVVQIIGPDILINGEKLVEDYGKTPIQYSGLAAEPIQLADDEFFLLGDNREVSLDSRYEEVGAVHRDLIEGKAILRIWPLKSFGTFR